MWYHSLMVIVTQKFSLLTNLGFLVKIWFTFFSTLWVILYLSITQQPVKLQNTAAPKFGVAHGALANGQVKVDLRSYYAGQQV